MLEDIKKIKEDVLRFMGQEVNKYPNGRMDTKQVGDLADAVKDLAMAEYYCTTAESMAESMGYSQPTGRMGYGGQQGGSGGMGGGRSGYGSSGTMGHTDPTEIIRNMMVSLSPEMRNQLLKEFM